MTNVPPLAGTEVVQRVLFPLEGDEAARGLYVRVVSGSSLTTRDSVELRSGARISLATYFAAFPAGYWRDHTDVEDVEFRASLRGRAAVRLCSADERVSRRVVAEIDAEGEFALRAELRGSTWLWVEVDDAGEGCVLGEARWCAKPARLPVVDICITTFDRPSDCVGVLRRLALDPDVVSIVRAVHVVDQGTLKLREADDYVAAAAILGGRVRLVEQPNLGGSGGFSRGMIDALDADADQILLLDDDVILEPESIRRMAAFAAHARRPTIVGAHMLSLLDRTTLHSFGERITRRGFWWSPVASELAPIDVAECTIESTPALRRVYDVDFNGWWMCMLPLCVLRRIGVALPMFIKWDDAELGLRASAAGIPTVSLPGAALWHLPWTGKDDGLDWQAYFQLRNRIVAALLHSRSRRGGGVLSATLALDVNHLFCVQYGSAAARRAALRDVLKGPDLLAETLYSRASEMRDLMARSGQTVVAAEHLPPAAGVQVPAEPSGRFAMARRLVRVALHQLSPVRGRPGGAVDASLDRRTGKWWAIGVMDTVTVESATGTGSFIGRRNRRLAWELLRDAVMLRIALWARWPRLARDYAAAAPLLSAPATWRAALLRTHPAESDQRTAGA